MEYHETSGIWIVNGEQLRELQTFLNGLDPDDFGHAIAITQSRGPEGGYVFCGGGHPMVSLDDIREMVGKLEEEYPHLFRSMEDVD